MGQGKGNKHRAKLLRLLDQLYITTAAQDRLSDDGLGDVVGRAIAEPD